MAELSETERKRQWRRGELRRVEEDVVLSRGATNGADGRGGAGGPA